MGAVQEHFSLGVHTQFQGMLRGAGITPRPWLSCRQAFQLKLGKAKSALEEKTFGEHQVAEKRWKSWKMTELLSLA